MKHTKLVALALPVAALAAVLAPGIATAAENDSVWMHQKFKGSGFSPLDVELQCPVEFPRYDGDWKLKTDDHVKIWFKLQVTRSPDGDIVLFRPESYSPTTLWKSWKGEISMRCAAR